MLYEDRREALNGPEDRAVDDDRACLQTAMPRVTRAGRRARRGVRSGVKARYEGC